MFNIEDKHDDLLRHLEAHNASHPTLALAEELGSEIGTMARMLRRMHSDLSGVENAAQEGRLAEHFRHVPCIADLDENAREVLYGIFTDLVGDIQYQLRQLTRYDCVDED